MDEKKELKILIVSQYFWPENFRVNDIVNYYKEQGAHVEILTGKPNYPGGTLFEDFKKNPKKYSNYNGFEVHRVPMLTRRKGSNTNLVFNYLSFLLSSMFFGFFFLRKKKFDYIFTFGTSPLTVAFTSLFLSKFCKSKTCLWVLDLWPEIIFELGVLKGKILERILSKIIKFILNKTDIIFAQSESYVKLIKEKVTDKYKVHYFPSWPEIINENSHKNISELNFEEDKLKIFFTGSIGDAQNYRTIAEVIFQTKNLNISWYIIGGGRRFKELIKLKKIQELENLKLIDFLPPNEIVYYQKKADVLFLSLKKGKILSSTIPGKFSTYLKYNKPILGLISGEVNNLINNYNVGYAVDPDDIGALVIKIKELINLKLRGEINDKFKNFDILLNKFDFKRNLDNFNSILLNNVIVKETFNTIRLVKNINNDFFSKNFILSGLNLSFLGHYISKEVRIIKNLYHWPDGLFKFILFKKEHIKIPGREFVNNLNIPKEIKNLHVLGELSTKSKDYLSKKFGKPIIHTPLPFGNIDEIKSKIPFIGENDICFLTLPTPKQEQIAEHISKKQVKYKIFCIGGAINMITGEEPACPKILESYGLETIWRLRTDTKRRTKRLLKTLIYFIYGIAIGRFKNLKGESLEK